MLFADIELAARVERAECRLLTDSAEAAARRRKGADVLVVEIAGGVATFTGPGSPLNKFAGLGFGGPVDEGALAEIEETWRRRATDLQAEVSSLGDPAVVELLTRRGYVLRGFENVLGRALSEGTGAEDGEGEVAPTGIEVGQGDESTEETWLDVLVAGFSAPDAQGLPSQDAISREALQEPIGDMAAGQGFSRYLAYRGGEVAGAAGLRVAESVALLCGAATLPRHRRQGVQSTLLRRRLSDAAALGCDLAIVTTQPGSKSQQNVQRQGFTLLYTRAILVREAGQI